MFLLETHLIETKPLHGFMLLRRALKKRGPQNEGISLWLAENKGDRKRTRSDLFHCLNVEQNKRLSYLMPKCY